MRVADQVDQKSRTLAADVLVRLRNDIIWCRLMPGEPLRFEALKEAYGASFTTLREALTALVADGLVVSLGHAGFRVAPVTPADLTDLTDTRVLIERQLIARSIELGGDDWEVGAAAALHRMQLVLSRHGAKSPEWKTVHAQFHEALVSAAQSPILVAFRATLFARAERYRTLCALYRKKAPDKAGEHEKLLAAVLSRKAPLAQRLIDAHIRATTAEILAHAQEVFDL